MADLNYGAEAIVSLSDIEHVRKRPGTYIGSVENPNHLALEIIANSLDEAMNGFGDKIVATFSNKGRTLTIEDSGRGIVVNGKREEDDKSTLEAAFSVLNTGGKYDTAAFSNSLGANGQGGKITNFLSTEMIVETYRDYEFEKIIFKNGEVHKKELGKNKKKKSGVIVTFSPDAEIFDTNQFDVEKFKKIVEQMSYLTSKVLYIVEDKDADKVYEYYSENGLKDYLQKLVDKKEIVKNQLYFNRTDGDKTLEVAMTYTNSFSETLKIFANNGENPEGGTHISSFRSALTRQLNAYARENNILKENEENLSGSNYGEGLVIILNLKAPDIVYDGQTKTKVNSTDIRPFVTSVANEEIKAWLESNPSDAKAIIEKALESRRASEAARQAREKIRKPGQQKRGLKNKLENIDKLHDASSKTAAKDREIFIVEGDSALGTGLMGRDPLTQAMIPIRGKSLNAQRATIEKVLDNKEFLSLTNAIGAGFGKNFDAKQSRYGKVILLTDADVDGSHIQILLMTFFFNYMKELVEEGMLYIASPPLYRARRGSTYDYIKDDEELEEYKKKYKNFDLTRFKGLGEMSAEDLAETTLDKTSRTLKRVTIEDMKEVEDLIETLMGKEVAPRKDYVFTHAGEILVNS